MSRASTHAANDTDEDLWTVPPERFVAVRNALAKKQPELKKLKRPSPSAWLVNVLVHTARKEVSAVFEAGDALHKAQGRVLAGADPSELQDAMRGVRDAINVAWKRARAILSEHHRKPTPDLTRRVTHTLRSAAIDKRLREVVEEGHLEADPAGDDVDALADVKVPATVKKHGRVTPAARPDRAAGRQRQLAEKREAARAAREEKARLAREAREQLKREAAAAEAEERRARGELDEAMKALERAKAAHKRAHAAHARAKKRAR